MEAAATYRLQLGPDTDLLAAADLVDYLSALGITHLYCSPLLQSDPDAPHGYAVVDYGQVDDALGGETARRRLAAACARSGLGLVLDLVPNHMAISLPANRWLWDVLEHGNSSPYAHYFDIDWERVAHRGILLPILGNDPERELEDGTIRMESREGELRIRYHDHVLPASPRSVGTVLEEASRRTGSEELMTAARALSSLPHPTDPEGRHRRWSDASTLAAMVNGLVTRPDLGRAVDEVVNDVNRRPGALEELLRSQSYRLAPWQTAARELDYRRFFDIDSLIGIRVEDPEVFDGSHRLALEWVANGEADGLRIDHPDGLRRPGEYVSRLRARAPHAWIVVEKILESDEHLPQDWPVDGTTGYDFLSDVTALLVDPDGEPTLTRLWNTMSGEDAAWEEVADKAKRDVLRDVLGADLDRLTRLLTRVVESDPGAPDPTRLSSALAEVLVAFDVYRTYVTESGEATDEDLARITGAVVRARRSAPHVQPRLFDILEDILTGRMRGPVEADLRMRFQQLTGPVMAKGVEDTAFYRYLRLAALCEVGGDPGRFGFDDPAVFHRRRRHIQERWPRTMLALTTHDTKRSEDVRARLAVLSEMPEVWAEAVLRWHRHNSPLRPDRVDGATEYLIYQTLIGAHPLDPGRLVAYLEKATKEAKVHTSWTDPDPEYDRSVADFARRLHEDATFRTDLEEFVGPLIGAGRINSLAQKTIQLTAPGVPDTYQGTELWDLSLVDPDNRRPVDYRRRRHLMGKVAGADLGRIMDGMDEGLPKLWLTRTLLELRIRRSDALGPNGDYVPLPVGGPAHRHAVSYCRGDAVAVVVPRLPVRLQERGGWDHTSVELPPGRWANVLDGGAHEGAVPVVQLLQSFPVAVLERS